MQLTVSNAVTGESKAGLAKTGSVMQADEEQLLLEAIDMAGFGNWTAVADHVGTKSKEECQVTG